MSQETKFSRRNLLTTSALLAAGGLVPERRDGHTQSPPPPADSTRVLGALPSELGDRSPFGNLQREVGRIDADGRITFGLRSMV